MRTCLGCGAPLVFLASSNTSMCGHTERINGVCAPLPRAEARYTVTEVRSAINRALRANLHLAADMAERVVAELEAM